MTKPGIPPHAPPAGLPRRGRRGPVALSLALVLALAGCAYHGSIDNPVQQKVTWFSYLGASDIRQACAAGAPDRYRLVYNGRYHEQLRSYEATADGVGGAILVARAQGPANLADVSLGDIQAPWRWRTSQARLSPAEFKAFKESLAASGFLAGPPVGLRLFSGDFWWVAAGCADGVFHYGAWLYPSDAFKRLTFPGFLFAHDETGVAVNPPRYTNPADRLAPRGRAKDYSGGARFTMQVGEHGLGGLLEAF